MDSKREWFRSEFVSHEMLEAHRKMESELGFYDAIAAGNSEIIEENIKSRVFANSDGAGKLSDNPVQNLRYHFVITTAMITRYCVHAGMEQEKAYTLSDFYIQKMDKARTIPEIEEVHAQLCRDFCSRMNSLRKDQVVSKPIVLCIDYIYSHIHYRITIAELAEHLNLSESYLSKLFKKEIGIPLSNYILELKLEKAKNLLQFSDYSIVDIANYLSFSSQSHFIQAFQKRTGITPHKYRTQNFRSKWEGLAGDAKTKYNPLNQSEE